jgi:ATP-dependent helicase/nuclease subunit A
MTLSPRDSANRAQLAASDPVASAFVGASAGSGKTKLLTDRLLRLMLAGVRPDRIQCLTFTKAAAAEMALRLQRTLGRWVTIPTPDLIAELSRLEVDPTPATVERARALFAQVLDLPGGMRIGTIHAFSQSLLRRFPLEAAISPHFQLVDDRDAQDAQAEAMEDMLSGAEDRGLTGALHRLAALARIEDFSLQIKTMAQERDRLEEALSLGPDLESAQRRTLGVTAGSEAEILDGAATWMGENTIRQAAQRVRTAGSPSVAQKAERILAWLSLPEDARAENWDAWRDEFVRDRPPVIRGLTALVNKKLSDAEPALLDAYVAEANRIITIEDSIRAVKVAEVSFALASLAGPVVFGYGERKEQAGLLDYDDLIRRTQDLLREPGAAWVLYKLDGGLDHLLLDEVQDTSPEQWDIALRLTEEFFAGVGARDDDVLPPLPLRAWAAERTKVGGRGDPPLVGAAIPLPPTLVRSAAQALKGRGGEVGVPRSIFAVGDPKQSIYSFQGADIRTFAASRASLGTRVRTAGLDWRDVALDVSFRSTAPVLTLVDAVFADPTAARGVVDPGATLSHQADRAEHAGLVELWPLTPRPAETDSEAWTVPTENVSQTSADRLLAEALADWIRDQTSGTEILESRGRPLRPGDVMVLVRRRNAFASALVRALKTRGVPVAGLDRMVLTEQPAVQDLLALCEALLLPQDDLTFACVLTSPLGGLDDDDLIALAIGRRGSLWDVLRARADEKPAWRAVVDFFAPLLARVDYATPHALLAEALGPLGGRTRLFARLGAEAAEPVAELLNAALTYGALHPPSLQGFLHWFGHAGAEVKREAEGAGNQVRVMTVHGAKGLQAPLVILPDTTGLPPDRHSILWGTDPVTKKTVPLLSPGKDYRCDVVDGLRDRARQDDMEEYNRLLYVALTRAEDRLLVCGWAMKGEPNEASWYRCVVRGFEKLAAEQGPFAGGWEGSVLRLRSPQIAPVTVDRPAAQARLGAEPPSWLGGAPDWSAAEPPPEPPRPLPLAPSRPEGVELGDVPASASPLAEREMGEGRFRRGQVTHALLQHLPEVPPSDQAAAAARYLARGGLGIDPGDQPALVAEVMAILDHPALAPLFGPSGRAEVPLTGVIGDRVVGGLVDRLAVLDDQVLMADFKTNRQAPGRVEDTPVLYLRQMATYRAVLRAIFPDRPVVCALIWTRAARVSVLPDGLLDEHTPP